VQTVDEVHITTWTQINVGTGLGWVKLTSLVALDQDELASLRQQTLWLSIVSLLSGAVILGLFLWRAYFSLVKREHVIADQLDDVSSRLHQSEKLASLGQLAAGVAHEINNPIGYVSSNLNTLNKYIAIYEKTIDQLLPKAQAHPPPALSPAIRQDVQDLLRETQEGITRVKNIIQDLKDFSRSNAVQHFIMADLHQGLRSTLNIVSGEVKLRADVVLQLTPLPEVECVPSQINQVFLNMVVNAAQAMPKDHKGKITIRSGVAPDKVWFEFEDNGIGMDAATIARIFDPFFTTKDVGTGTGLGLSVSLGIVKRHGGQITVNSTPGTGTTFKMELPMRQPLIETNPSGVTA
jgi:signal transduction histidine kinase